MKNLQFNRPYFGAGTNFIDTIGVSNPPTLGKFTSYKNALASIGKRGKGSKDVFIAIYINGAEYLAIFIDGGILDGNYDALCAKLKADNELTAEQERRVMEWYEKNGVGSYDPDDLENEDTADDRIFSAADMANFAMKMCCELAKVTDERQKQHLRALINYEVAFEDGDGSFSTYEMPLRYDQAPPMIDLLDESTRLDEIVHLFINTLPDDGYNWDEIEVFACNATGSVCNRDELPVFWKVITNHEQEGMRWIANCKTEETANRLQALIEQLIRTYSPFRG